MYECPLATRNRGTASMPVPFSNRLAHVLLSLFPFVLTVNQGKIPHLRLQYQNCESGAKHVAYQLSLSQCQVCAFWIHHVFN
jgi:hypothetical protein